MKSISNVKIDGNHVTFTFDGNVKSAAELRSHLMKNIKTTLIDTVTFKVNTSQESDETLAKRLGQLIIKSGTEGYIKVNRPGYVSTKDLMGIDSVYDMNLVYLDDGESLECCCKTITSTASEMNHQRFSPTSHVTFDEVDHHIVFNLDLIGLLTWDEIYQQL